MIRQCPVCGNDFETELHNKKYCSPEVQEKFNSLGTVNLHANCGASRKKISTTLNSLTLKKSFCKNLMPLVARKKVNLINPSVTLAAATFNQPSPAKNIAPTNAANSRHFTNLLKINRKSLVNTSHNY